MRLLERAADRLLGAPMAPPDARVREGLPAGVKLRSGSLIPRIGGLLARMGAPASAVTLRRTIVVHPDVELTPGLLAHELEHVRQWHSDPLFPVRYALATLRHGYHANPYEIAARRAAVARANPPDCEDPT